MKKIGIVTFVVALVAGVTLANMTSFGRASGSFLKFPFGGERGSGNVAAETRNVSGFKSVDVGGVYQVEITSQKEFGVEVLADDNLLPFIKTEVKGSTLEISSERKLSPTSTIRIRISAPNIENLQVAGVANVTVNDLKNTSFAIDSSGASKIAVTGETSKLTIDVSGASKIDAEDLKAENASVDSSGASKINVNVSGELRTDLSGASKVVYSGTPANVLTKKSGASSVSPKQ
ncbi:MAG TPA: head GIN domain-containing protein [Pyrinomonadaceae bacterium]|nr:head GIN domain-containing protein [Pyrinomonadaceae bacterium]